MAESHTKERTSLRKRSSIRTPASRSNFTIPSNAWRIAARAPASRSGDLSKTTSALSSWALIFFRSFIRQAGHRPLTHPFRGILIVRTRRPRAFIRIERSGVVGPSTAESGFLHGVLDCLVLSVPVIFHLRIFLMNVHSRPLPPQSGFFLTAHNHLRPLRGVIQPSWKLTTR